MKTPNATRPALGDLSPTITWEMAEREFPESSACFDAQDPLHGHDTILRIAKRTWTPDTNAFYLLAFPRDTDPILIAPASNAWEGAAAWHADVRVWVRYSEWSPWVVWPQSERQLKAHALRQVRLTAENDAVYLAAGTLTPAEILRARFAEYRR